MKFFDWLDFAILSFRFDISLFFTLNLLPLILLLLPFKQVIFRKISRGIFVPLNCFFLLLNVVDIPFFAFNSRRSDFPTLQFLLGDSIRQIPQLAINFWYILVLAIISAVLLWRSFKGKANEFIPQNKSWVKSIAAMVFVIAAGIGFIRNSFAQKPLLPGNAFTMANHEAGHAALNTGFVIFKTLEAREMESASFLPEGKIPEVLKNCPSKISGIQNRNLVLIILESFATEYTGLEPGGARQTPFLDSLARVGVYFSHHFANGRTSRDALPSILGSIPAWMDESFSASPYVSVPLEGLGNTLTSAGYSTAFFHGGKNGTMSFDMLSGICGFKSYYGLNEYPGKGDFDGNWGVFDGPFLQFSATEINKMKPPFAAGIFTLSSHQPYTLPKGFSDTVNTGGQDVYKAIRYADNALRKFFQTAAEMPWFDNTLFVITADHTHLNLRTEFNNYYGCYDVPLVFYAPDASLSMDTGMWVQHTDIRPTVLEILGHPSRQSDLLGHSFVSCQPPNPMQYQDGFYHVLHKDGILVWDGIGVNSVWRWESPSSAKEPAGLRTKMMARLQHYRNGLKNGNLFQPNPAAMNAFEKNN